MAGPKRRAWAWYLLLVVPFVGTLWVPFYDFAEPRAFGIPFFYWYQFVWIGVSAGITAIVYLATPEPER
jgi:Protein of unknown function (DUF3311)